MRRNLLCFGAISALALVSVACSPGSRANDLIPSELSAQTPRSEQILPESAKVIVQRQQIARFIAEHDSLRKIPGWYTASTGGTRPICDVEIRFTAAKDVGTLMPSIKETGIGGIFEADRKEVATEFARSVFRDGFTGCRLDGAAQSWFVYLDRARDAMAEFGVEPADANLTVEDINKYLLTAAKRAVIDYKIGEYIRNAKNAGGVGEGGGFPQAGYILELLTTKYSYTAEQVGLNPADLEKYLRQ